MAFIFNTIKTKIKSWFSTPASELSPEEQASKEISLKNQPQEDDQDNQQQQLQSTFTSIIDGIKVAMATLLSIFVPQYCEDTQTTCTLQQNFSDLTMFNTFVIAWNFISLGLFVITSIVQNRREQYFISHLDESRRHPFNSLLDNTKAYPRIRRRIKEHNDSLYFWSYATFVFFILNILFSCILIFYYFYDGFRSATTLIANVLLVFSKLYFILQTTNECRGHRLMALSTLNTTPVSYNIIDENYSIEQVEKGKYQINIKIDEKAIRKMRKQRARSSSM